MSQCTIVICDKEARWEGSLSTEDGKHSRPVGYCDEHLLLIANSGMDSLVLDVASAF